MIEVNLDLIGKKVVYSNKSGYLLVKAIGQTFGGINTLIGETTGSHKNYGYKTGEEYSVRSPGDFAYYEEGVDIFDFTRFGCNAQHVKELLKALDKRYTLNKEK